MGVFERGVNARTVKTSWNVKWRKCTWNGAALSACHIAQGHEKNCRSRSLSMEESMNTQKKGQVFREGGAFAVKSSLALHKRRVQDKQGHRGENLGLREGRRA